MFKMRKGYCVCTIELIDMHIHRHIHTYTYTHTHTHIHTHRGAKKKTERAREGVPEWAARMSGNQSTRPA